MGRGFAISDQTADTIARLFVENIVCWHGVPEQLLSDRGTNFLSDLIRSVCDILGVEKINASGYHPQTDGLVEKFNSTLVNMVAKCCEVQEHSWDEHLPYLLFAYRSSVQESTRESPFYLLYGRDPRLPTETVLCAPAGLYPTDIGDYRNELTTKLASAWANAKKEIEGAQAAQKCQYDHAAKDPKLRCGDRVMVCMPSEVQGKDRKLPRPYHGPYRVLNVTHMNAKVVPVDHPRDLPIFVSLSLVRHCYEAMADLSWSGPRRKRRRRRRTRSKAGASDSDAVVEPPSGRPEPSPQQESVPQRAGPVTRSMTRTQSD